MTAANKLRFDLSASITISCGLLLSWLFHWLIDINQSTFGTGVAIGILLSLIWVNLLTYIYVRNTSFILLGLFVTSVGLTSAAYQAVLTEALIEINGNLLAMLLHLSSIIYLWFCLRTYTGKGFGRKSVSIMRLLLVALVINFVIHLLIVTHWQSYHLQITLFSLVALGLGSACWLWKKNFLGARSLSLAWVLLAVVLGVEKLSWTTEINLAEQWIFNAIVAFLGWLTLTFLFVESQTRRIQESKAFNDLEEKNQALQDILNAREERPDATEELEFQVQERTLELEIALRELSEKNQELEEKNTLDALTNIRNRSYFDKKYLAELRRSRREQTSLSVAMLDIDHFKAVNDEYGHLAGDECIKAVATIIQQALKRPSDDVCRYGGEEFALILPNTDISGAVNLVEQIREQIAANKIRVDDLEIQITASIGVASSIVTLTQNEEALIALADKQLYQAKAAGRNQVLASQLDSQ